MRPPTILLDKFPSLAKASIYFCFLRSWWDGAGVDAGIWWQDESGCFQRLCKTGETVVAKAPLSDKQIQLSEVEFEKILDYFSAFELPSIPSQKHRLYISHCDDWYGFKTPGSIDHWLYVAGGKHSDPRVFGILNRIFELMPQLLPGPLNK